MLADLKQDFEDKQIACNEIKKTIAESKTTYEQLVQKKVRLFFSLKVK